MRFQHSVGLLTNNNNNNNNSLENPALYSSIYESSPNLNQTIHFTRDLNFTSHPDTTALETALKSINGNYQGRLSSSANNNNNDEDKFNEELTDCRPHKAFENCTSSWNGGKEEGKIENSIDKPQKFSTVKTQEKQSQYSTFGRTISKVVKEIKVSASAEPQINVDKQQATGVVCIRNDRLKLDLEGNCCNTSNNNDERHTTAEQSDSSSMSTPTTSGTLQTSSSAGSTPDDNSFLDDDEDDSPFSSSSRSHNVRLKNFPRGIINPNYPGFQHLAHRLAEHFVNHSFEQCSDSDNSDDFEYDMTSSGEHVDIDMELAETQLVDNEDSGRQSEFCSSNENASSPTCSSSLDDVHDELSDKDDESKEKPTTATPDILIKHKDSGQSSEAAKQTKITAVDADAGKIFRWDYQPDLIKNINSDTVDLKDYFNGEFSENNENNEMNNEIGDKPLSPSQAPAVTAPPPSVAIVVDNNESIVDSFNIQSTTSTIDIVGDFGREIEKEIGLIVSGYTNQALVENYFQQSNDSATTSDNHDRIREPLLKEGKVTIIHDEMTNLTVGDIKTKMTDAILSNANEIISICPDYDELVNSVQQNYYQTNANVCSDKQNDEQQRQQHELEQNISKDSERKTDYISFKSSIGNDICVTESHAKSKAKHHSINNSLPTAIVKPKYQKSSFDDRQLPPVGCIAEHVKPWYLTNTGQTSKRLPQFERKSGRLSGSARATKKEQLNSLLAREKDVDSSSVAIVQPRKKEKMELNYHDKRNKTASLMDDNSNSNKLTKCYNNNNNNNNNINTNNNNNNNNTIVGSAYDSKKAINNSSNNYTKSKNSASSINKCGESETAMGGSKSGKPGVKLRKTRKDVAASFDVYNIETALPVLDLEAIESHLKAAKEEDRRRRNDREEIRRRLAMGADDDYYRKYSDKPGRKPSLHSRLQNGMNLQICFMNETASDTESPSSDSETCPKLSKSTHSSNQQNNNHQQHHHQVLTHNKLSSAYINPYTSRPLTVQKLQSVATPKIATLAELGYDDKVNRPTTLSLGPPAPENSEIDFFTKQAKLQIEARMALAQAKDMAHMQMEIDRQRQQISPITQIIRNSMEKVGIRLPEEKRRLSRHLLTTDINVAQLQIIVNDLHTEIEKLNEKLMTYLMERDELHMSQDSMLVDIEDLTRYLSAKEQNSHDEKMGQPPSLQSPNNNAGKMPATLVRTLSATSPVGNAPTKTNQSKLSRITQLVKK